MKKEYESLQSYSVNEESCTLDEIISKMGLKYFHFKLIIVCGLG